MAARRLALIALTALTPIALVGCGDDDGADGSTDTTVAADPGNSTEGATIVIKDVAFTTPDVTVAVGGTVTFDNQDNQAHTATGDESSFATDTIAPGEAKTVTFDEAGTFPFICSFHPFMKGSVTVD